MLRLKQITNAKTERPVSNQYTMITNRFIFFVSYETFICAYDVETKNLLIFDYLKNLDVSRTTAKYLYQFLDERNFRVKNFDNDVKLDREKVMYKKIELASRLYTNVKYIPDSEVENLFNL